MLDRAVEFQPIRQVRIRSGVTIDRMAQVAGRSLGWYAAAERGLHRIKREDAETLAGFLGVSVSDLFDADKVRPKAA